MTTSTEIPPRLKLEQYLGMQIRRQRQAQELKIADVARIAGISQGIAGLFLEAHPDPDNAKCDGPCALRLDRLEPFLTQMQTLDNTVKAFPAFDNH